MNYDSKYRSAILRESLSIYDPIDKSHRELWIPTKHLEHILNDGLVGFSVAGLPLRTRSKVVKQEICKILGYPAPSKFKRSRPRFPGQDFDTYIQKSNNLQIWNQQIVSDRRYVIIRLSEDDKINKVKVITGQELARLDTTGTLTQKYQARLSIGTEKAEIVTDRDTANLLRIIDPALDLKEFTVSPTDIPSESTLLAISKIFDRLKRLVGTTLLDVGIDQERNRGALLHTLVCKALGYRSYHDDGQFPDVKNQLVEVKLQTSPTIDLGLELPSSERLIDFPRVKGISIRVCDVRYAIFSARIKGGEIHLMHLLLTTGEGFFNRCTQFGGKIRNLKLQIPLQRGFFD